MIKRLISYTLGNRLSRMELIRDDVLREIKKHARQHVRVFRCDKHPDIDGMQQWACPECFKDLLREDASLGSADSAQQDK